MIIKIEQMSNCWIKFVIDCFEEFYFKGQGYLK